MKIKNFFSILLILILLASILTGCGGKPEGYCESDTECVKAHYEGACLNEQCQYTAIPGECGNKKCEESYSENECSCPIDCGACEGAFESTKYLKKTCNSEDKCLIDVPEVMIKPVSSSNVLKTGGNELKVITEYPQPFNFKKDTFDVRIILDVVGTDVSDLKISKIELIGTTESRQTVVLARKIVNKYLRNVNSELIEKLILDLTTGDYEGELENLELQISEDHLYRISSPKTTLLKNPYRGATFTWVKPDTEYKCPESCDDNNPGTQDVCGPETDHFCENKPIPNACGNFVCDVSENQCTCPQDCGLCQGSAGAYLDYICDASECKTKEKTGIAYEPMSIFDDRNLNFFHIQNNYKYNTPFNTKTDQFELEFSLYNIRETVTGVKITEVRLLEGSNELVSQKIQKPLQSVGATFTVKLPIDDIGVPESEKAISLTVYYEYTENENTRKGSYTKTIGKIPFINPTLLPE